MSSWGLSLGGSSLGGSAANSPPGGATSALSSLDSKISSLFSKDPEKEKSRQSSPPPSSSFSSSLFSRPEPTTTSPTTRSAWGQRDEPKSYSPTGLSSGLTSGLGSSFSSNLKADSAMAAAREAQFEAKVARDEMLIETEIFKMDEEFLKSQMKMMGNQINSFNAEFASIRNDITFESSQRKELSSMFESYMKNYMDDIEGRLKAHIGQNDQKVESLARALQSSEQKLDVLMEDNRRFAQDHGDKVRSISSDIGAALDQEKMARATSEESIMQDLRLIRKYLDDDLKRTLSNHFDTYSMIETSVRDVSSSFANHVNAFESHVKSVISNDEQRERMLEERFMKLKGEFGQELIKVAGMSKDIDTVRSMIERETGERQKEMGLAIDALKAEDAKVQKAIVDDHLSKRDASQMMQDFKRALDTESGERGKSLDRLSKQLDDQKRDLFSQNQKALVDLSDGLAQKINDLASKTEGVKSTTEANMQRASKDADSKLSSLEQSLRGDMQRLEAGSGTKHQDLKDLVADADKRTQLAIGDMKAYTDGRVGRSEETLQGLQRAAEKLQADLTSHKSDADFRAQDADNKVQRALQELKTSLDGQQGKTEDGIKALQQAHSYLQDDMGKIKDTVRDVGTEASRALNGMQASMDGRHSSAEDAIRQLQQGHAELQGGMGKLKMDSDGNFKDTDDKIQRAMKDLKQGLDGRQDAAENALKNLQQANVDLQSDLGKHKRDSAQETDTKVQQKMEELSTASEARHNNAEEILKKLVAAHTELQGELKNHRSDTDGKLRDADAAVQRALNDVRTGMDGRHDKNEDILRKLQQAQADLKGDLASHKSDAASALTRGLSEEQRKRDDSLAQLKKAHSELQSDLARGKNDNDRGLQDVDRRVQQALAEVKTDNARRHEGHEDNFKKMALEHDTKARDLDAKVMQSLAEVMAEQSRRHDGHTTAMRDLGDALSNHKGEHEAKLREADALVQKAMADLKSDMAGSTQDAMRELLRAHADLQGEMANHKGEHNARLEDADKQVQQALAALRAEMNGSTDDVLGKLQRVHGDLKSEISEHKDALKDAHSAVLQDADAKLQRAMNDLKGEMDGKHDGHEDAMKQLKDAHAELQAEMANHKGVHDAKLEEADAKVTQAMRDLQLDMQGRHDDHGDTLKKIIAAHQDIQTDLAAHKNTHEALLQDADAKVQQAMADLKGEMAGRHDGHEDAMKQLKDAHAELQQEMANHKGVHDEKLEQADAKVMQAMRELHADMTGRHDSHADTLQTLARAHQDIQSDLATHKEDVSRHKESVKDAHEVILKDADSKVQRAMADLKGEMDGKHDGHQDAMKQLKEAHAELQQEMANQKGVHDAKLDEADAKVMQAMRDLQADMQGRHDDHGDTLQKLMAAHQDIQTDLATHKNTHEALLQDADAKVQRAMDDLKGEMAGRHDGHEDAMKQLKDAHAELQQEMANHKGVHDARLEEADTKVQEAMRDLQAEMSGRHEGHDDALQKLMRAHQDIQSDLSDHKDAHDARLRDADAKVASAMDDLKMELFGRHDGHDDALQKLRQAHADIQADLSDHKGDADGKLQETDRRIQQTIRELEADLKADHEAKLGKTQRDLHERHDAADDALRKLMQAHSDLQGEMAHHKGQTDRSLQDSLGDLDLKHQRSVGELRSALEDGLGDTRSMISSLQRAHADLQETTQRTERSVKDAGATNLANHEFLTNTLNSMERNLTTLDTEHHGRITDLRNHFDRFMKDGLQDQEQQTAQALTALQNAFEERTVGMEQEVNRKLRDTLTELVSEQEELQKSVQKLRSNNWDEQFKRVWEAIDTHTHDVNVEDIEEDTTVTTQIIRPPQVQQVVVPEVQVVKTSVLNSPTQRSIFPVGTGRLPAGAMSPTIRGGRALSPTAVIRPGTASPRALSPLGSAAGSLTAAMGPAEPVNPAGSQRFLGKMEVVSTEKIAHHVDLHCGSAIFK